MSAETGRQAKIYFEDQAGNLLDVSAHASSFSISQRISQDPLSSWSEYHLLSGFSATFDLLLFDDDLITSAEMVNRVDAMHTAHEWFCEYCEQVNLRQHTFCQHCGGRRLFLYG